MKETMFGITGKVFYVLAADYSTGDLYYMKEIYPDNIVELGCVFEYGGQSIEVVSEKTFEKAVFFLLRVSDFNPISFSEEMPRSFIGHEKDILPGLFIGNYEPTDEEHQKKILKEIELNGYSQ